MRVGVDFTSGATQVAGIGRSVRELVAAMLRRPDCPQLTLFYAHRGPLPPVEALAACEHVRVRRLPVSPRLALAAWHRLRLPIPIETLLGSLQVFHGPDFTLPPLALARGVLTVHDLTYVQRPQDAHPAQLRFLESAVPRSIDRARLIIAVSETTRRDLMQRYGVRPQRIRVVPNAVGPDFVKVINKEVLDEVRRRLAVPDKFVLSVGTVQPRKNIDGLASAVSLASRKLNQPIAHLHVGRDGWLHDQVYGAIESGGSKVRFVGHVSDETLRALYSLASVFAFPSHAEGFGLPILEAFACECPVVTSACSGTGEVAGDAAALVDPSDAASIAEGLAQVLSDECYRGDLRHKGAKRARSYSWDESARLLLEAYHVAGTGGRQ
ncbi:MAG TPA: glycosyltransferase family 1 protein [Chloroflexi bacterium]|nr:glycosyltransferase family 1 protein [Chloroflexota bacterium]